MSKVIVYRYRSVEQTLQSNNLINQSKQYLESQDHLKAYLDLISKIGFIDKQVLEILYSRLISRKTEHRMVVVKILYEQMYLDDNKI